MNEFLKLTLSCKDSNNNANNKNSKMWIIRKIVTNFLIKLWLDKDDKNKFTNLFVFLKKQFSFDFVFTINLVTFKNIIGIIIVRMLKDNKIKDKLILKNFKFLNIKNVSIEKIKHERNK